MIFTLSSLSKKVIDAANASASIASCIRKHSGGVQNDQVATSVALIPGERGASYHRTPRRCGGVAAYDRTHHPRLRPGPDAMAIDQENHMSTAPVVLSEAVADAVAEGRPVVALESTIISHGLPRHRNLEAARLFEQVLNDAGVTPATVAVIDGVPLVGLGAEQVVRIAEDVSVIKVSSRDLGPAIAQRATGATTVAATALLAHRAGLRVFSTGGLGGVHRGAAQSYDESADLVMLSRLPITVISAGVKSILDIPATLERLETLGVTVLGYRTRAYPAFYLTDSGYPVDWRVDSAAEIAEVMAARDALRQENAVLVANPVPPERQLDPELHDRVVGAAIDEAGRRGVTGKDVTPFLLARLQEHTGGASLEVNIDIVRHNIALGGEIATAWSRRSARNA